MITGIHNATFDNLQLNAGAFLRDFDYASHKTVEALKAAITGLLESNDGTLLGMTQGGGTFQCSPTIRNIEGDGLRAPFVGGTVNDGWTVKLTGTLKEITPGNFKAALMSADHNTVGQVTTVKVRTAIKKDDYIPSMVWVGDTARGMMLIALKNVLNIAGATFTFTDKGEGTIPFEFQAHQESAVDQEFAPCEVIFLDSAVAAQTTSTTGEEQPAASE